MGLRLDNSLTVQTKRRFLSSTPATIAELRNKYQVMSHMWLLAQMRQPTRPLYGDLTETTFGKFLNESLSVKNFLLERDIAGTKLIVPNWTHCLEKEFQLRKEALRLAREEGHSMEKALWTAYRDPHHRIEHWLTLLTIANSGASTTAAKASSSSPSSNPANQRLQRIEKKFAEFERTWCPSCPSRPTCTPSPTHARWRKGKRNERQRQRQRQQGHASKSIMFQNF